MESVEQKHSSTQSHLIRPFQRSISLALSPATPRTLTRLINWVSIAIHSLPLLSSAEFLMRLVYIPAPVSVLITIPVSAYGVRSSWNAMRNPCDNGQTRALWG